MTSKQIINNNFLRIAILAIGFCATGLGVLGIFLPVLPTVPLLLLAAACFARSSERFHQWLLSHNRLGPMIKSYTSGQGIPLRSKVSAIGIIWIVIPVSAFIVHPLWLKYLLVIIAISITLYLLSLPISKDV
jgi:uncharacterized membrane protein YbaN (DUF454 family)